MSYINSLSSLDVLRASVIGDTFGERARRAMTGLDSKTMLQVKTAASINSILKEHTRAILGMDGIGKHQISTIRGLESVALKEARAAAMRPQWSDAAELVKRFAKATNRNDFLNVSRLLPSNALGNIKGIAPDWTEKTLDGLRVKKILASLSNEYLAHWHDVQGADPALHQEVEVALKGVAAVGVVGEVTLQATVSQFVEVIDRTESPVAQDRLFQILVAVILLILGALLNPVGDVYVKKWLTESEQGATKEVRAHVLEAVGSTGLVEDYRFVATGALKVRTNASMGSPCVGELRFGHAVRVVEKRPDFTLVAWTSSDGTVLIRGWVLSRYLKSFS